MEVNAQTSAQIDRGHGLTPENKTLDVVSEPFGKPPVEGKIKAGLLYCPVRENRCHW